MTHPPSSVIFCSKCTADFRRHSRSLLTTFTTAKLPWDMIVHTKFHDHLQRPTKYVIFVQSVPFNNLSIARVSAFKWQSSTWSGDLFDEDGNALSFDSLKTKFSLVLPCTRSLGILYGIPIIGETRICQVMNPPYENMLRCRRSCIRLHFPAFHSHYLQNVVKVPISRKKWEASIKKIINEVWRHIYKVPWCSVTHSRMILNLFTCSIFPTIRLLSYGK